MAGCVRSAARAGTSNGRASAWYSSPSRPVRSPRRSPARRCTTPGAKPSRRPASAPDARLDSLRVPLVEYVEQAPQRVGETGAVDGQGLVEQHLQQHAGEQAEDQARAVGPGPAAAGTRPPRDSGPRPAEAVGEQVSQAVVVLGLRQCGEVVPGQPGVPAWLENIDGAPEPRRG